MIQFRFEKVVNIFDIADRIIVIVSDFIASRQAIAFYLTVLQRIKITIHFDSKFVGQTFTSKFQALVMSIVAADFGASFSWNRMVISVS
jgi:hypothetical protein